jgi:hypothetical protein
MEAAAVRLFGIRTHRILTETSSTAQPNFVKRQPSIYPGLLTQRKVTFVLALINPCKFDLRLDKIIGRI